VSFLPSTCLQLGLCQQCLRHQAALHACRCINIVIAEPSITQEEQSSFNLSEGAQHELIKERCAW
jgi:hypothetical protein